MITEELEDRIDELINKIRAQDEEIIEISHDINTVTYDLERQKLDTELMQYKIKHEHEETGIKPTQAKEKARMETQIEQERTIKIQKHLDNKKIHLQLIKGERRLLYTELEYQLLKLQPGTDEIGGD